jgi:outer membrane protein assembly factor BamB
MVPAVIAAEWSTGVGSNPARTSLSAEVGPTERSVLWSGSRSAIVAQQGVACGDLFVTSRISSFTIPTGTWIVAHDLFDGDERWAVQLPFRDPDEWRSRVMAIRDGHVYASRSGGEVNPATLFALDPADGSVVWESVDLIEERTTESPAFADDGDLIIGNFSSLMRIDKDDGTTVWEVPRSCPTSNGCSAAVFGNAAYVWEPSPQGPKVTRFDVDTGARRYSSLALSAGFAQQLGLMVGPDGTIYCPRTQNNPATDFLVALEDTGTALVEKWRRPLGYVPFASLGIGPDGTVYTYETVRLDGEADLTVLRLDPATGAVIDDSDPVRTNFPAQPRIAIDAHGKVFLTNGGFSNGALVAFDADLTERWRQAIPNVNVGGPVLGDEGVLVVCGIGSNVVAYDTKTPCPPDVDGNGVVDSADLILVLAAWGVCDDCPEDVNGDDVVDTEDLLAVIAGWGPCK